jgi:glycosyltransferase involved in cell wall biosynthesis
VPLISLVIPVRDRQGELRRALKSVAAQTLTDFECIVVDDCSRQPIQPVVLEFDERFRYVRRNTNGGPTAARFTALEQATGQFVTGLDSDNELFPWALERAVHYLRTHPEAGASIGQYVFPDGLRARVASGVKVVRPEDFVTISSFAAAGDAVALCRRDVVEEWLVRLHRDYFASEFVFWLSMFLGHSAVYVDEPWGRFHTAAANKVSAEPQDPRRFGDVERFIKDFRPLIGTSPCGPLDELLVLMWPRLIRAHRYDEAAALAGWMRDRGLSTWVAAAHAVVTALRRRVGRRSRRRRVYII